jgi:hypothetical protein
MMWRRWQLKRVFSRDKEFLLPIDTNMGDGRRKSYVNSGLSVSMRFVDAAMDIRAFGGLEWG